VCHQSLNLPGKPAQLTTGNLPLSDMDNKITTVKQILFKSIFFLRKFRNNESQEASFESQFINTSCRIRHDSKILPTMHRTELFT